jgi:uncharacterized protein
MAILGRALIHIIRKQFALNWKGLHGAPHWARVRENGLRLAETTGANTEVIELFAFLHDSRRLNDDSDYEHGKRAAMFAQALASSSFELAPSDLEDLLTACRGHSDGLRQGNITVLTSWDADRLDLGRVGIKPHPNRLCTEAARDPAMIEWAYKRSVRSRR